MNILTEQIFDHQGERRKKTRTMKKHADTIPAFLLKTYEILENPIYHDIVSWNDEGDAMVVKRVNEFSEQILPRYFKHSNFASFVRQLNMYDFHKNRNESSENEFKHKLFMRGSKSLLSHIKRKSGDCEPPQQQQLVLKSDKPFTEFNELVTEMALLANKQSDLEKLIKNLIKQNEKFQKDNKYLWNELMKNKQKSETQQERVLLWFLQSLAQPKNNNTTKKQSKNKNLLMIGDDEVPLKQEESIFQKILGSTSDNEVEPNLEGLSQKQILQGLLQAFSFQRSNKKTIKNLQSKDEEDSSSDSEPDEPFKKQKKVKQEQPQLQQPHLQQQQQHPQHPHPQQQQQQQQFYQHPQDPNKSQIMLYQDNKNSYGKMFSQYPSVSPYAKIKQDIITKTEAPYDYQNQFQMQDQFGQEYLKPDDYISDFLNRKDSMSAAFNVELNDQFNGEY